MDKEGPLSLQDQTFLYLLSHLDSFSSDCLALLPKAWRRRLLLTVSPLQLYKLEVTDVAKDIDTNEIWYEISTLNDSVWASYVIAETEGSRESRELMINDPSERQRTRYSLRIRFFNYICHLFFNTSDRSYVRKRLNNLIFTIHKDKLDSSVVNRLLNTHIQSMFMFSEPYYLVPFRCKNFSESAILKIMIEEGALPKALEVHTKHLSKTELWKLPQHGYLITSQLFGDLQYLTLHCTQSSIPFNEMLCSALGPFFKKQSYFSHGHSSLRSLEVLKAYPKSIEGMAFHLSAPNGYNKLKKLYILTKESCAVNRYLSNIIDNQLQSLEHLTLSGFYFKNDDENCDLALYQNGQGLATTLEHVLSQLTCKPHFRHLKLDNFNNIPQSVVQRITDAYLRGLPRHKQKLQFTNCSIKRGEIDPAGSHIWGSGLPRAHTHPPRTFDVDSSGSGGSGEYACLRCESMVSKHLVFESSDVPINFLLWLGKLECICLNTLEFNQIRVVPEPPPRKPKTSKRNHTLTHGQQPKTMSSTFYQFHPRFIFDDHPNFHCRHFKWQREDEKKRRLYS